MKRPRSCAESFPTNISFSVKYKQIKKNETQNKKKNMIFLDGSKRNVRKFSSLKYALFVCGERVRKKLFSDTLRGKD